MNQPTQLVAMVQQDIRNEFNQRAQLLTTIQQVISSDRTVLSQEIVQVQSYIGLLWDHLHGINPNTSNPAQTTASKLSNDWGAGRGNSSGSGSGKGTLTTSQSNSNQSFNTTMQRSGRGSGSGSNSTNHTIVSKQGLSQVHPLTGSGSGSATVYGNV